MKYKKYLLLFLVSGFIPLAFLGFINLLIDPYEVFQTKLFKYVGATQERYLKIEHLKKNNLIDTVLLGSSRVGTTVPADINKFLAGQNSYNFFVSSGSQYDNLVHSRWIMMHRPNIKTIYIQIDWPDQYEENEGIALHYLHHPEVLRKNSIGFLRQYIFNFSYDIIKNKLLSNLNGIFELPLEQGYFRYPIRDRQLSENCENYLKQNIDLNSIRHEGDSSEQQKIVNSRSLNALAEIVKMGKDKGVKINLYITPHNHRFLDGINLLEYQKFLLNLSEISSFWNFGFYSTITNNDCNYYESSHYIDKVAPLLFIAMKDNDTQDFKYGHLVTKFNIRQKLNDLEKNFKLHRKIANSHDR